MIEEAPRRAFVSFEAGGDAAVLEEERAGNWQPVCTAPCQKDLPLDATYRISGAGIRNSNGFRLNAAPGDRLRLTADTASSTAHTLGMVMLVGSASVGLLAFWFLDLAADAQSYDSRSSDRQMGTAVVTVLVSAVVGAVGLGLVLGTQTTSAKQELVVPKARDQASTPRLPTWSEARPRSEPELRAPTTASLFTVHFDGTMHVCRHSVVTIGPLSTNSRFVMATALTAASSSSVQTRGESVTRFGAAVMKNPLPLSALMIP